VVDEYGPTLLDFAKRRDGRRWIVALLVFSRQNELELLVPAVVIDEFKRNRPPHRGLDDGKRV